MNAEAFAIALDNYLSAPEPFCQCENCQSDFNPDDGGVVQENGMDTLYLCGTCSTLVFDEMSAKLFDLMQGESVPDGKKVTLFFKDVLEHV